MVAIEVRVGFSLIFTRNHQLAGSLQAGYQLVPCHDHITSVGRRSVHERLLIEWAPGRTRCSIVAHLHLLRDRLTRSLRPYPFM